MTSVGVEPCLYPWRVNEYEVLSHIKGRHIGLPLRILLCKEHNIQKRKKMKYFIILIAISVTLLASNTVKIDKLEWQDNSQAKTTKLNWQDAKEYCSELDLEGYDDWRLPNIKELQSIVDISRIKPAIKRDFSNVENNYYWSSSEYIASSKSAWVVYFYFGYTYNGSKSSEYFVRCVRARQ